METWELKQRQSLPLDAKIVLSQRRIREWYEHYYGNVYVSFSGGKDSTVLLHLVRQLYPDTLAFFADTGLEYPEIREFAKATENAQIVRPKIPFTKVIEKFGYPVISKEVSTIIYYAKLGKQWALNRLKGLETWGDKNNYKQRYIKYAYLLDAPFEISHKCCIEMKEKPLKNIEKQYKPFIGLMATESMRRQQSYLKTGCNAFNSDKPSSTPLAVWTEQDILQYIKRFNLPYSKIYGDILETSKGLQTTGEERTGCMFCCFGIHLQKGENKFQRMAKTHSSLYNYCINRLGIGKVLDYIGVNYRPEECSGSCYKKGLEGSYDFIKYYNEKSLLNYSQRSLNNERNKRYF